jgi:hypothetical protein
MNVIDLIPGGLRNASIVVAFLCIVAGFLVRESSETNRGLGMALIVVGGVMIATVIAGRYFNWW